MDRSWMSNPQVTGVNKLPGRSSYRAENKNGSRIFGVGKYFHSKSTRPFLITKKGI